jgi:UDP-glucose 4-epimerase
VKIAVTGGMGFIGQAVMKAAASENHTVWAFDRSVGHDVMGPLSLLEGADTVIHLAGMLGTSELFDDPHSAVNVNIHGTLNVLEWCHKNNANYVGITMPPVFPSVYTATKVCADRLATAWHLAKGVGVSKVRAFNAYGPGQKHGPGHPQKILPTFATEAWNNRPIPIWGNGEQTVDLVHVDDLGRMLVDAAKFTDDETFDGGTGVPITVNQLANFVLDVTGSTAGIEYLPMRSGENPTKIAAEREGWRHLSWNPTLDWSRVKEAVESYRLG